MRMELLRVFVALLAPLLCFGAPARKPLSLQLVHLNDFHAKYEPVAPNGGPCRPPQPCVGGIARVYSAVWAEKNRNPEALFLNAGDNFQGTLWYSLFRWNVTAHFMNMLPHDALTLGNHEFDHGVAGVVPFMESINTEVLLANVEDSGEPTFQKKYVKSKVIQRHGRKIGVVGFMWRDTSTIAETGKLRFLDELASLDDEASRLKAEQGVDIVLGLSHSGLDVDREVAAASKYVDVIVGGHSHSLLYNGTPPGGDIQVGPYPEVIQQPSGRTVLVVQASAYTKYLGNLTVQFDAEGEVISWEGSPIYLDSSIPEDERVLKHMEPWRKAVDALGRRVLGNTAVALDKNTHSCYEGECTLGNFVTDAMVDHYVGLGANDSWTRAAIAMTNAGGLRATIEPGNITYGDMVAAQPFENTIDLVELQGRHLLQLLEDSVNDHSMLHWSGLRVVFDAARPANQRVVDVSVRCADCRVPEYAAVDPDTWYSILVPSFVAAGGDDFKTLTDNFRNRQIGPIDSEVFEEYLARRSPITTEMDGRIVVLNPLEHRRRVFELIHSL